MDCINWDIIGTILVKANVVCPSEKSSEGLQKDIGDLLIDNVDILLIINNNY